MYEAALATLQRAEEEEARADAAAAARTGDGLPAQRLRIARQDLAELQPNTRMLSQARIGVVECAGVFLVASAAGGYWAGATGAYDGGYRDPLI